jgi:hypothetical protein
MGSQDRPQITERDLDYNVAIAGAEAKDAAAQQGGDPAALRSLVGAAKAEETTVPHGRVQPAFRGQLLRQDDLAVTMCLDLHGRVFGVDLRQHVAAFMAAAGKGQPDANSAESMQALADLAFIFCHALEAWEELDIASDPDADDDDRRYAKKQFRRRALEFAGGAGEDDIAALCLHLARLARRVPASDEEGNGAAPAS